MFATTLKRVPHKKSTCWANVCGLVVMILIIQGQLYGRPLIIQRYRLIILRDSQSLVFPGPEPQVEYLQPEHEYHQPGYEYLQPEAQGLQHEEDQEENQNSPSVSRISNPTPNSTTPSTPIFVNYAYGQKNGDITLKLSDQKEIIFCPTAQYPIVENNVSASPNQNQESDEGEAKTPNEESPQ